METPVIGLQAPHLTAAQVIICPRGFETPWPDFGIDVGDPEGVDQAHAASTTAACASSIPSPTNRGACGGSFVEDPDGHIINVLAHLPKPT